MAISVFLEFQLLNPHTMGEVKVVLNRFSVKHEKQIARQYKILLRNYKNWDKSCVQENCNTETMHLKMETVLTLEIIIQELIWSGM